MARKLSLVLLPLILLPLAGCQLVGPGDHQPTEPYLVVVPGTEGEAPFQVTMYVEGPQRFVAFRWDLGDGTVIEDENFVVHTYSDPGLYPVQVRVRTHHGKIYELSEIITVKAPNRPPVAVISAVGEISGASDTFLGGEIITFDGRSSYDPDGTIVAYIWDIDGESYDTPWVMTSFWGPSCREPPMEKVATLTVIDDEGETATETFIFYIVAAHCSQ